MEIFKQRNTVRHISKFPFPRWFYREIQNTKYLSQMTNAFNVNIWLRRKISSFGKAIKSPNFRRELN